MIARFNLKLNKETRTKLLIGGTNMSKILLKDKTEYELDSYENKDNGILLEIKDMKFADVAKKFTEENTSYVELYSDLDEVVGTFTNYSLGNKVTVDSERSVIELSLEEKEIKSLVATLKAEIKELQEKVDKLEASKEENTEKLGE